MCELVKNCFCNNYNKSSLVSIASLHISETMSEIVKEIIDEAKKKLKEAFGDEDSEEKVVKYLKKMKEEKECELCIDSNA